MCPHLISQPEDPSSSPRRRGHTSWLQAAWKPKRRILQVTQLLPLKLGGKAPRPPLPRLVHEWAVLTMHTEHVPVQGPRPYIFSLSWAVHTVSSCAPEGRRIREALDRGGSESPRQPASWACSLLPSIRESPFLPL